MKMRISDNNQNKPQHIKITHHFFVEAKKVILATFLLVSIFCSANVLSAVSITSLIPAEVGVNSIRLNATIGPSTISTRVHFIYGLSSVSLNSSTPEQLLPASTVSISTSAFVSSLACGATYYYRVVASNAGNETLSSFQIFTTLGCVSIMAIIDTQDATKIEATSARLNGKVSLDGDYLVASYHFEYGLNSAYGTDTASDLISTSQIQPSADIFDLSCGTTYHYRLVVKLKKDATSDVVVNEGNDLIFVTAECSLLELYPVSTIGVGSSNATISIPIITDGSEVDLFVQWGETENLGEQTEIQKVNSGTVTVQMSDLACGISYYYVVVVQDGSNEVTSEMKDFVTKSCSQKPSVTTSSAIKIFKTSATISGTVSPNEADTSAYFEYGLNNTFDITTETKNLNANLSGQIVQATLTGLTCATEYSYRVFATNANGQIRGDNMSFTTSSCDATTPDPEPQETLQSAKVFAGKNHSIILGNSGEVITWGDNRFFQLGGLTSEFNLVDGVKSEKPNDGLPPLYFNIIDAAAGGEHSLILLDKEILSFGSNNVGQLGAFTNNQLAQEPIWVVNEDGAAITNIIDVDAGNKHSIALRKEGGILLWGDNSFGQLAIDQVAKSTNPILMTSITNAIQIAAGANFNLAVLQDKTLVAWGANNSGQLGFGSSNQKQDVNIVSGVDDVKSLAAGAEHALVLRENGSVLVWGNNQSGQLGIGHIENQTVAVPLDFVGASVIQIAAGGQHSIALLEDGTMMAWGDNSFGQLGIASDENVMIPTKVVNASQEELTGIISISGGENFTVAVDAKGNILSWGDNSMGQLNGKISTETDKLMLVDQFDVNISLNTPRIIVDKASISIERGSVSKINVRLSGHSDELVVVTASFDVEIDDFFIERDNRVFFSPDKIDWPVEKPLTISSTSDGKAIEGMLSFSAPGFATVDVPIKISGSNEKPKERVVGALPPVFILFLLSWFILTTRFRTR